MKMRPMSPRESRLVAVLVLVAVLALVEAAVVQPIVDGFATRAQTRRDLATQYLANDRVIAAIPRLARAARAAQAHAADDALPAPDAATAGEALRARMEAAIAAAGGDMRGGDDVPAPAGSVAIRIAARLSGEQLGAALARLQNAAPYPIITGVEVSAGDALVTGHAATMDVSIDAQIPWRPAPAR